MLARPSAPSYLGTKQAAFVDSPAVVKPPPNNLISVTKPSVLTTGTRPHHSDRRSLKRAAPTDSCSFRSSPHQPSSPPDSVQSHSLSHSTCYRRQRLSGPSLPTIVAPTVLSGFLSGDLPVSSNAPSSTCTGSSSCVSTAVALSSTSVSSQLPNAFTVSSTELHSVDLCSTQQPFPTHSILRGFQPNMYIPGTLPSYHNSSAVVHQPYPLHQPSAPPHPHPGQGGPGPISGPYLTQLAAHGTNGQTAFTLSSGSNSGKTTPRQPAKKRLEARTPTIDGAGDDSGALATGSHSNTPSLDDSTSMVSTICSGPSSMAFRVHQNTPFVPVQSRSGRPSSSGSSSSASGFQLAPAASTAGVSPSVGGLLRKTSHFGASDGEAALPAATRASIASTAQSDDEEEELVGIMVGRSVDSVLHSSSDTATSTGDRKRCATLQSGNQPLGTIGTFSIAKNPTSLMSSTSFPEVGRSPMCERHVIEMIGALLANSAASPSFRRSSQSNSRRSASASSLPYVGTSPNENLPHLTNSVGLAHPFASITNTRSSPSYICSPAQSVSGKFPLSVHPEANAVSNECDDRSSLFGSSVKSRALHQHNLHSSTPPPRLTPMSDLDGMRLPDDSHSASRLPALQPLQLNGESNPSQEIVNFIRNSPASGITPELIDMLYNMAQQYGVHQPRAGSRASRSSSQVAQNFYRSLINGSVCSSPFPANPNNFGSLSNTLNVSNTACQTDCVPVSSTAPAGSSLLSPASCSVFSSTPPMHHLRGLSFTPLSVDPDQTNCSSTSNVDWADPVSAAQSAPPLSVMQLPHYPSRAVTHSCGLNQPRGPLPSHTSSSDEGPCRQSVKH
ncbi:unnamed protein product [Dicrocoelium dendriticum]|nr:unnamed protein product [Dicrocoelium dendriticum]CAH8648347.1 unnamed protein product [Dicrocoelium dendriticum]